MNVQCLKRSLPIVYGFLLSASLPFSLEWKWQGLSVFPRICRWWKHQKIGFGFSSLQKPNLQAPKNSLRVLIWSKPDSSNFKRSEFGQKWFDQSKGCFQRLLEMAEKWNLEKLTLTFLYRNMSLELNTLSKALPKKRVVCLFIPFAGTRQLSVQSQWKHFNFANSCYTF